MQRLLVSFVGTNWLTGCFSVLLRTSAVLTLHTLRQPSWMQVCLWGQWTSLRHLSLQSSVVDLVFDIWIVLVMLVCSQTFLHPFETHSKPFSQWIFLRHWSVQFLTLLKIDVTTGFFGTDVAFLLLNDLQTLLQPCLTQSDIDAHSLLVSHSFLQSVASVDVGLLAVSFDDVVLNMGDVHMDPHDNNWQHLLSPGHSLSLLHSITQNSLVGSNDSGHTPGLLTSADCPSTTQPETTSNEIIKNIASVRKADYMLYVFYSLL